MTSVAFLKVKKWRAARRACVVSVRAVFAAASILAVTAANAEAKPLDAIAIELAPVAGYNLTHPRLIDDPPGLTVRGRVCHRLSSHLLRSLVVERLAPDGTVIAAAKAQVYPRPLWRKPECARYAVKTDWHLGAGDTLRVQAAMNHDPSGDGA